MEQPDEEEKSGSYSPQYTRPQSRDPRTAVQAFNRGTQYQQKGDWDRAIYYYRRAIDQDPDLVFFAGDLEYISSAGLRVIIFAKQKIGMDAQVYLIGAPEAILNVIKMSSLDNFMTIQDTYEE